MVKCVSPFLLFNLLSLQAMPAESHIDSHRPKDVVDITTVAPDVRDTSLPITLLVARLKVIKRLFAC